jgi:uncharacterized protein YbjT (DUF2867 family)
MTAPILVTGGTGTLGRLVVPRLRDAHGAVRVLSRSRHEPDGDVEFVTGDLATGDGVEAAMTGVDTVLHAAGSAKGDEQKARFLVRAAARAGVRHIVYISVVGADRVPVVSRTDRAMFGYFGQKRGGEEVIAASGVPWTTLRATQFHDLALLTARAMAKLPLIPAPAGFQVQPVDTGEVADRLVDLTLGSPAGLVPDLGGPEVFAMNDLIRSYLTSVGKRRPFLPVRMPGRAAAAVRAGANLLGPGGVRGHRTWAEFLADRPGSAAADRVDRGANRVE